MSETGEGATNPGGLLAEELEYARDNPIATLFILDQRLGVDMGERIGPPYATVAQQGEAALENSRAIKHFGEVVGFLSRYSIYNPPMLGAWLDEPNDNLWYRDEAQKPLDVIWQDVKQPTGERHGILRVLDASKTQGILLVSGDPHQEEAKRKLLDH